MSLEFDFSHDSEFNKLLAWRTDIDLIRAALELARDSYPQLDFSVVTKWIQDRVDELRPIVNRTVSERESLEMVAKHIAYEHGLMGDETAYTQPDGSFLQRVIETRQGIPISLSLLHMAVCQGLGIDLQGVGAPRHFLARLDTPEGPLFLDAYAGCRILTRDETLDWISELTDIPRRDVGRHLIPVGARQIIFRMLNNLKVIHAERLDWTGVWRVQSRITALSPSEYAERRDLALAATQADRAGLAIRLLKSLLNSCPENDREMLELHLKHAESIVHRWN